MCYKMFLELQLGFISETKFQYQLVFDKVASSYLLSNFPMVIDLLCTRFLYRHFKFLREESKVDPVRQEGTVGNRGSYFVPCLRGHSILKA